VLAGRSFGRVRAGRASGQNTQHQEDNHKQGQRGFHRQHLPLKRITKQGHEKSQTGLPFAVGTVASKGIGSFEYIFEQSGS
jgi:hypothetical protein